MRPALRGSPPRVWGIHKFHAGRFRYWRFTPTRVGNTRVVATVGRRGHGSPPRVWGIRPPFDDIAHLYGSPPRVWGILVKE